MRVKEWIQPKLHFSAPIETKFDSRMAAFHHKRLKRQTRTRTHSSITISNDNLKTSIKELRPSKTTNTLFKTSTAKVILCAHSYIHVFMKRVFKTLKCSVRLIEFVADIVGWDGNVRAFDA